MTVLATALLSLAFLACGVGVSIALTLHDLHDPIPFRIYVVGLALATIVVLAAAAALLILVRVKGGERDGR